MKKLILVSVLLLLGTVAYCQDTQTQDIQNNKAVVNIQKQPTDETSKQKQDVKSNWFCVVVQVNGKVPFDKSDKD